MNAKIKWLRDKINLLNIQGIIISNPVNIRYLTNIEAEGVLLITRKENIYITDGRFVEEVHHTLTIDDEISVYDAKDVSIYDYENFFSFCENVGFEENYITYAKYKQYMRWYKVNNFEETDYIIEKQRAIKEEGEIQKIEKACEITDNCFSHLRKFIKIGMTEKEVANEIEKYFKENGAEGVAFETIVATGANSSKPHAVPTDKKIERGDVIVIDMGCKYQGYCSDMTRTVFAGTIPEEVKPIYELVLKNQKQVQNDLVDGANLKMISKMVENDFQLNGYDLIHSIGHGVGLETHELPYYSLKNDAIVRENMVLTNEPGIYIPNRFGVRIEDTVVITKSGSVNLTKSDKHYIIVGNEAKAWFFHNFVVKYSICVNNYSN